jgi:predicted neuraminidase
MSSKINYLSIDGIFIKEYTLTQIIPQSTHQPYPQTSGVCNETELLEGAHVKAPWVIRSRGAFATPD